MILLPIRTAPGQNVREHHQARARRVRSERETTRWFLVGVPKPATPCVVTLTRIAPSNGLDDDNLSGACKSIRDEIAAWLGVDDKHRHIVRYAYAQMRGKEWGVLVEFKAMEAACQ
jgi:predicted Fe-S protein YdhL (DUF1289 family)